MAPRSEAIEKALEQIGNWAIEEINRIPEYSGMYVEAMRQQKQLAMEQMQRAMSAPEPIFVRRPQRFIDFDPASLDWERRQQQPPVKVLDKPDALPISVPESLDPEYAALAKKVGFALPELEKHTLLSFLQENGFHTYDIGRVASYMQSLVDKHNQDNGLNTWTGKMLVWGWRPLRKQDPARGSGGASGILNTPYDKPIPMPVLQTVAEISEKLPDAQFYVSDYDTTKPDPFLAVTLPGMKELVVIERWDEPAFR